MRFAGLSLPDNAVGSLSKLLGHRVALIDDEVLVENLEDFTTLKISHVELRAELCDDEFEAVDVQVVMAS